MAITAASIDRLKAQLLTSGLSQKDQPLFQVINSLIEGVRQSLSGVEAFTPTGGGGGGSVLGQSFITKNNDQVALPNSRQILPGTGIGFNDNGQRLVISSSIPPGFSIDGEEGLQGPPGIQGPRGLIGPSGGQIFLPDSALLEDFYEAPLQQLIYLANGNWINVPYAAGDFTADTGPNWDVGATDLHVYAYLMAALKCMILKVTISVSSITGTPNALRINIPGGMTARYEQAEPILLYNNGAWTSGGVLETGTGATYVSLYKNDYGATNWAASVNTFYIRLSAIIPVQ